MIVYFTFNAIYQTQLCVFCNKDFFHKHTVQFNLFDLKKLNDMLYQSYVT